MKKIAVLSASMGTLFLVGISVVTLSGIKNHLSNLLVKAEPTGYSVTFNESNTSFEVVDVYGDEFIVFTTTTDNGNKVGMVGYSTEEASFTFKGASFMDLCLFDIEDVLEGRAYQFSTITGFAISFSSKEPEDPEDPEELVDMNFESMGVHMHSVKSGTEYKGLSITPSQGPSFRVMGGSVTVSSLTIWYSC